MNNINEILKNKQIHQSAKTNRINPTYEIAKEFGDYVGLDVFFVMRLFKKYGRDKVLNQRSWLYDIPVDKSKGSKIQLITWKLNQK